MWLSVYLIASSGKLLTPKKRVYIVKNPAMVESTENKPNTTEEAGEEKKVNLVLDEPTGEMVSKNELKKRVKLREKEEKARIKAEEKAK